MLTDLFGAGLPGIYCIGWKLNGLRTFSDPLSEGASSPLVPLTALAGVYGADALVGLKTVLGVARCDNESLGANVPYLSDGKVADMGDNALGLNPSFEGDMELSKPSPTGGLNFSSSGGGVGVLGGAGMGLSEAMVAV
jgi:hypothetical protein